jgi:hypothetical protein
VSDRDQALVRALGINEADVARAMDKSKQAVNRGVRSPSHYFKVHDLAKALDFWRASNNELYARARQSICDLFPELADTVLAAANATSPAAFRAEVPGEYWLVSGSFSGFRTNLPRCAAELETLCASPDNQVKLFVNDRDVRSAQLLSKKFGGPRRVQIITCTDVDLRLVPTTLLRIDLDGKLDLFGVADVGFIPLSQREAARMHEVLSEALLADENAE